MNNKDKQKRGRPLARGQTGNHLADGGDRASLVTDLLILSDGTVLAHNLTPVMAAVLHKLNPEEETMRRRTLTACERASASNTDCLAGRPAT